MERIVSEVGKIAMNGADQRTWLARHPLELYEGRVAAAMPRHAPKCGACVVLRCLVIIKMNIDHKI